MHLSLTLMGPFAALLDGEPVSGFQSNKVRGLLAYLAVELDRPHARETLAGLLWPRCAEAQAHHSLNQALSNLRSVLHDQAAAMPFLLVTPHSLQFNRRSDHWLDVEAIEHPLPIHPDSAPSAPALGSIEPSGMAPNHPIHQSTHLPIHQSTHLPITQSPNHPITLSSPAPFLEGLALDGCPDFEEWVVMVRERLHRLVVDALRHEADACARRGDFDRALQFAWRQIELDPWLEEAHLQVMRWLAATGRRSEALVQYHLCRRRLAEELGIEPAAGTTRLYQQIRDGGPIPPEP